MQSQHVSSTICTTEQLPLHRRHKTRAGGVATPKDTHHSTHGPGSQKGGEEQVEDICARVRCAMDVLGVEDLHVAT